MTAVCWLSKEQQSYYMSVVEVKIWPGPTLWKLSWGVFVRKSLPVYGMSSKNSCPIRMFCKAVENNFLKGTIRALFLKFDRRPTMVGNEQDAQTLGQAWGYKNFNLSAGFFYSTLYTSLRISKDERVDNMCSALSGTLCRVSENMIDKFDACSSHVETQCSGVQIHEFSPLHLCKLPKRTWGGRMRALDFQKLTVRNDMCLSILPAK